MSKRIWALALAALVTAAAGVAARADGLNLTAVKALGTDSYTRYVFAGQVVTVAVRGDGDTDLDLYVDCPCGRVVARDDDDTDRCLVRFRATESGAYRFRVVNRGYMPNVYAIAVAN